MLNTIIITDEANHAALAAMKKVGAEPLRTLSSAREFKAHSLSASGMVAIIDGDFSPSQGEMALLANAAQLEQTVTVFSNTGCMTDFQSETLAEAFSAQARWGIIALVAPASFIHPLVKLESTSTQQLFAKIIINAVSENRSIEVIEALGNAEGRFSNAERALCLRAAVDMFNIEELFPKHPWNTHEAESLAACYHTLAGTFIKLDDTESALQCLALSDQFEDSPRSLALKGIIASLRGEALGAVANMVSSLQQYELRKNPDGHYLYFTPENIEVVNVTLRAGLEALNQRNNEAAFAHFTKAIVSFDPFFQNLGLIAFDDAGR